MKRTIYFMLTALAVLAASCSGTPKSMQTETHIFADTTRYCATSLSIELPTGSGAAESLIRDSLVAFLDGDVRRLGDGTALAGLKAYTTDNQEYAGCVEYYGKALSAALDSIAASDDPHYPWECSIGVSLTSQTESYAVFNCSDYLYMGGAHGGITGSGPHTFNLRTGKPVRKFISDAALMPLQDELKKGLLRYFSECGEELTENQMFEQLFIEDGIIPLPEYSLAPADSGLTFTYKEYEIAPYAVGMPSFTIPFEALEPFLTPEAREILAR